MRIYAMLIVSSLLVAGCALAPPEQEIRVVSDRATIKSTRLAADLYRIDFEADLSKPASEADRFMPSGSPILAEAERICPNSYSIVKMSEVDIETDLATNSRIARSSGTVSCVARHSPGQGESL